MFPMPCPSVMLIQNYLNPRNYNLIKNETLWISHKMQLLRFARRAIKSIWSSYCFCLNIYDKHKCKIFADASSLWLSSWRTQGGYGQGARVSMAHAQTLGSRERTSSLWSQNSKMEASVLYPFISLSAPESSFSCCLNYGSQLFTRPN